MNVFAKFDEIISMIYQDIKERMRNRDTDGRKDGRTDGKRENSIPTHKHSLRGIIMLVGRLILYVLVNNFSVMLGRSHRFLGITSTFWGENVSCSMTQHV